MADRVRIVLVPGLGLTAEAWRPTRLALADALQVRGLTADVDVVELPGFGLRADRGEDLHPRPLAAALVGRALARGGPPVVLGGHSASCQVVAHAAALAPDRVRSLLLVGPTTDQRAATWARLAGRWLATAAHERPGQVPALVRQYARTGLGGMARAMAAARHDRIERALGEGRAPVLVVRGRHDRIAPADWAQAVAGSGGGPGKSVTLSQGGHMVPLTHGRQVAAVIAASLG